LNCQDLVKALRIHIADPSNRTWREVLRILKAIEEETNEQVADANNN
jgi:hypothetical protein